MGMWREEMNGIGIYYNSEMVSRSFHQFRAPTFSKFRKFSRKKVLKICIISKFLSRILCIDFVQVKVFGGSESRNFDKVEGFGFGDKRNLWVLRG